MKNRSAAPGVGPVNVGSGEVQGRRLEPQAVEVTTALGKQVAAAERPED